jgi:hypothetical protein
MAYDVKGDRNKKLVKDILRRVRINQKIKDSIALMEPYDIQDGERPEHVSFKFYGSPVYHWVILLVNEITDPYYGWPLSQRDFQSYVSDKYANPDAVHHYEITQQSGPTSSSDNSHKIQVNSDVSGAVAVSNREYEEREQEKIRSIKILPQSLLEDFISEFNRRIRS